MVSFKEQCTTLRKRGFSINQIVQKTHRPKTSVYFHIQNLPLNKKRKREIRTAAIKRLNKYSRRIKGQSRLHRHPTPFDVWNTQLVSLVGHMVFDGDVSSRGCVYTNRSLSLHQHVADCMVAVYSFPPKRYESLPEVYKSAYYNVELGKYISEKEKELLQSVAYMEKILQRAFLRAFFDDEGSVYFIGNRRAVRGYQHDEKILRLIQKLLKDFGVESNVDVTYNEITITRKENIDRFAQEINFTAGVCVNGLRKNSIWKQSLEKREILKKALASYQS